MVPGVGGTLISGDFAGRLLEARFAGRLGESERRRAAVRLARWWTTVSASCGPASSVRSIVDVAARPLVEALGFEITRVDPVTPDLWTLTLVNGSAIVPLVVIPWQVSPDAVRRSAVRCGLIYHANWCLVFNGTRLQLVDAGRAHARRHLDLELPLALEHAGAFGMLWGLLRGGSFAAGPHGGRDLVSEIVDASDEEGRRVSAALRTGVRTGIEHMLGALVADQVRRVRPEALPALHEEALTAVYRLLFLLFAEARGLVPTWHPIYRDAYSIESLRRAAMDERPAAGTWEALQAVGRLAHAGCRADDLAVTAFNGRLFSPLRAPHLETARLNDASVRDALLAVSTVSVPGGQGRHRIAFGDLGVEELGAVYEGLLEYEPHLDAGAAGPASIAPAPRTTGWRDVRRPAPDRGPAVRLERTGTAKRKSTGTFYTPSALTRHVVRQTLDPLVANRTSAQVLALRICDPAMGSGAFLVAACRHLARAYEAALVADGGCTTGDLDERDRAGFRRLVAQRCLFGVDLNPMAVQLARLSLWLTTLAADLPLTFLDHHLVCGDSLIGAAPTDLLRVEAGGRRGAAADRQLLLFDPAELAALVHHLLPVRHRLERTSDLSAETVREKEAALAALDQQAELQRWRIACDLWTASACRERPAPPATLRALLDHALHGSGPLPAPLVRSELEAARQTAARLRLFHWPLEFPEVFHDDRGRPCDDAGFDAVVSNPPWDMLRADAPEGRAAEDGRAWVRFARRSHLYTTRTTGHSNQYQLFVDRALDLTRPGGRVGLVVPGGLAIDASAAPLRRRLMHQCRLETIDGFDNRAGLFPIHRSTRFLLLVATRGGPTTSIRCRFGLDDPAALEETGGHAEERSADQVVVTPALLERLSGPDLPIPLVTSPRDLQIAEKLVAAHPRLVDGRGWQARFARELNATDHRRHFRTDGRGLPVLEGKHVTPFHVRVAEATLHIDRRRAAELLGRGGSGHARPRIAFRDVASATNRQTVIAAIVPGGSVTTHTLFCLRTPMTLDDQRVLCALLNSHPVNFLVRQRVSTHVSLAVMRTIPVPRLEPDSPLFQELASQLRALDVRAAASPPSEVDVAAVQAIAALAFDLTVEELEHILSTFRLEPRALRERTLETFARERRRGYLR